MRDPMLSVLQQTKDEDRQLPVYPAVDPWRRVMAAGIDVILPLPIVVTLFGFAFLGDILIYLGTFVLILWNVYLFVKDGLFNGSSIGKLMMGLMVVHLPMNLPCSMSQSARRVWARHYSWGYSGTGGLFRGKGITLADLRVGTQVIMRRDYRPNRTWPE